MTARELELWLAYDRISPISDMRGDIQTAQVVAAVYNAQGGKVSLSDALIQWQSDPAAESGMSLEGLFEQLAN